MVTNNAQANVVMDALGVQTRRDILALLRTQPLPVGEIASHLPISRPAVSKHLRVLERAGLVEHTAHGTQNIFRLRASGFSAARGYLASFWDEALTAFQQAAEDATEADR
jgi:DNA-binding transcriptional ArsR family regulator